MKKAIKEVLQIRELMKAKGITREEMAVRLKMTTASITNVTHHKTNPSLEILYNISIVLDCDIRELFVSTKKVKSETNISEAKKHLQKALELL